jgi:hypothetical protein
MLLIMGFPFCFGFTCIAFVYFGFSVTSAFDDELAIFGTDEGVSCFDDDGAAAELKSIFKSQQ